MQQQLQSIEWNSPISANALKQNGPDAADFSAKTPTRVRVLTEMRKQVANLTSASPEREKLLAVRQAHRDKLETERKARQTACWR